MKRKEQGRGFVQVRAGNVKMNRWILLLSLFTGVQFFVNAQNKKEYDMKTIRVRYMVNEIDPAIRFYTKYFGFQVGQPVTPNFAMLSLGGLELVLSTPFGPGGAAKPMKDGRKAEPGGWNRLIINVDDLAAEVARLREAHLHFRNDIATGPGGSEILLEDPSGNPIELFQPVAPAASDEEAAIRALMDRFVAAFNAGNIDAIMENYVSDSSLVVFDIVPRKEYRGADAYRKAWMEMFSRYKGKPKIAITDLGITAEGNVGFSHCFMRVTGTDMEGHSTDRTVRVTDGYRKIGGNWLIVLEHISVPVDLKTGKPALAQKHAVRQN